MTDIFFMGLALGGAVAVARIKVFGIVPICMLFVLVGVTTLDLGPFVAVAGTQLGYVVGSLIVAMATTK